MQGDCHYLLESFAFLDGIGKEDEITGNECPDYGDARYYRDKKNSYEDCKIEHFHKDNIRKKS